MKKQLWRNKQCAKCPWRVDVDPNQIPNGYSKTKHENLKGTIAEPASFRFSFRAMACHESTSTDEEPYCVGWLFHQLGPGNNIGLRIKMLSYDLSTVQLCGEQHRCFEDTIP